MTACICMVRGHGPEGCGVCNETGEVAPMTTEPKDVRGGDFAQQNEPKTPSDPPPVREAVAFRWAYYGHGRKLHWTLSTKPHAPCEPNARQCGVIVQPLYLSPDPMPVSREAVARAAWETGRRIALENGEDDYGPWPPVAGAFGWQDDDSEMIRETELAKADAILALTGETSRE